MGFGKLFGNMFKAASAQAQKNADKIEEANMVEFGKQDIEKMEKDLREVKGNIGTVKGEIAALEDQISELEAKKEKHYRDAEALMEKEQEELATENFSMGENLEGQINTLKMALETQQGLLIKQQSVRSELEMGLREAQSSLSTIVAMENVTKANGKLANISGDSGKSALESFKERQEKAKKRMIRSEAVSSESASVSLEKKTAAALGGSSLDRLKERMAQKKAASE